MPRVVWRPARRRTDHRGRTVLVRKIVADPYLFLNVIAALLISTAWKPFAGTWTRRVLTLGSPLMLLPTWVLYRRQVPALQRYYLCRSWPNSRLQPRLLLHRLPRCCSLDDLTIDQINIRKLYCCTVHMMLNVQEGNRCYVSMYTLTYLGARLYIRHTCLVNNRF